MAWLFRWLTHNWLTREDETAPVEVILLRSFGLVILALSVVDTFTTRPHPGLHGRGLAILLTAVALIVALGRAFAARRDDATWKRIAALSAVAAATAVLSWLQPNGFWPAGAYLVAILGAMRLERITGLVMLGGTLVAVIVVSSVTGHAGAAVSVPLGAIPWYFVMRLIRQLHHSREAQAQSAAAAERGRLAREMHDVLAHSLSALALQLESTRLLARDRGADPDVTRGLDRAHHLAASGLEEARRAIAAERGDGLAGPERIAELTEAFQEQSGLPIAVEVHGEPRELAADASLAIYRTAQEALTNVRRHAAAQRVEVSLAYLPESTVLVVQDRGADGAPALVPEQLNGGGYGLTGMRERAELLGGELFAAPTRDGFRVELRLPT